MDLVSAVHVGDADYYAALQQRLSGYDRVLYELVVDKPATPAGRRWRPAPPSPRRRIRNPVALAQRFIAAVLRLELQLEQLDYCALPCACFGLLCADSGTFIRSARQLVPRRP